ncbi:MAG: NAD(P)H-hydrate dehydratase, partial [Sphingomonas bacterium]|nr:NAD(P)H-hydrate dehydratase [Sphingomonas bacterium]
MTIPLDARWLAAHPLPRHEAGTDKNSRGKVLAVGGSATVPGAIRLTAEAAFRAGAG